MDDDPGIQDAFRLIFERAGYEAEVLGTPSAVLSGTAALPDLYILDKQLSGVDGLDVCRVLKGRQETSHIPVIIVSATPNVGALAKDACADGFLEKPFRQRELLDLVAQHLSVPE